ncbi:MerR family transcriptional regulator [Sphingoaurantiacus capsulatus]|uniref:MerR family transcriptional regulator n=1 Tax=Sphingoaurantiacus capsulatus TaxID=1771310 RepID=A0ABV7X8M4_9SPHN
MRMRELEQRTGVGRETIRFYIREGLLPEPERASRNSASYTDDHVARVRAIKRLQEERFLPLAIIKNLLDASDSDSWLHADAFPHLDATLRARLDGGERPTLARVMEQTGAAREDIDHAVASRAISIAADGTMDARDAGILKAHMELKHIGFTEERGFHGEDGTSFYADFVDWLVTQEMRLFFDHTAGVVGEEEAANMAERGISAVNEMLSLMRTREILRRLEARRRIANDNG